MGKNIVIIGIIAFLAVGIWSLYSMPIDEAGRMINCSFMKGFSSFCHMNLNEHINQHQMMFALTKEKNLLLISLLTFLFCALLINKSRDKLKFQPLKNHLYKYKPEIKLFDHLLIAFSRGILNPKIY